MEPAITLFVALPTSIVSRAVDLYHQPGCQADKVGHEGTDGGLAPELVPAQLPTPEVRPEPGLDSWHVLPQPASAQDLLARRHAQIVGSPERGHRQMVKTSAPLPFGCAEGPPRRAGRRHG